MRGENVLAKEIKEKKNGVSVFQAVREYAQIRTNEGMLKTRKDALAKIIKEYATKFGVKDQNGSYYAEDEQFKFGNVARKSIKIDFDLAKAYFTERKLWEQVHKKVEVIDEEAIDRMIDEGIIPEEDVEKFTTISVSYAISVVEKKAEAEMPEIQQVAASKRGKSLLNRGR